MRKKIYHKMICTNYEIYAPMIAVNSTNKRLTICDRKRKSNRAKDFNINQELRPHGNEFINLNMTAKSYLVL